MKLDKSNYHTDEANRHYMSHSQYQDFLTCEAMAMAKLQGWKEPQSDALLLGSYVHAYFEGPEAFERFKEEHPEIFSSRGPSKGELKSSFQIANTMISTLENDPLCMFVMRGEKEVVLTAEMFGAVWKVKIDNYNPDQNRFSDLKTVSNIRKEVWDPRNGYVTFVEANHYITQMAVYAEVERRYSGRDGWLEPIIVAVSKEDPPDKEVIGFKAYDIERELFEVEQNLPRILDVKAGREEPKRCERCRYCRETKQLKRIVYYADILAV
jgi:hypothetical protein